jgi:hypothetical protein
VKRAHPRRPARIVVAAVALAGLAGRDALATSNGGEGKFVLDASSCSPIAEAAIRRIVAIEIGDLLIDAGAASQRAPRETDRLQIGCVADVAQVEASAGAGSRRIARSLLLRDFPGDAAPRALALAGLEALAALSPAVRERIQNRPAPPAVRAPAAPAPPGPAAAAPAPHVQIGVAIVRRTFPAAEGISTWGARVAWDREIGARWNLAVDLEADGTQTAIALGEASALLGSVAGFWGLRLGGRRLGGVLALGWRAGVVRLAGDPTSASGLRGNDVWRPWTGPAFSAGLLVGGRSVAARLFVETGITARGARGLAQGETVVAVSGPWITGGAGISF